jgi:hypothetical protein
LTVVAKAKTAVIDRRYRRRAWRAGGLLLGLDGGLDAGVAALVVSDAAFLFDVFVELLTHGKEE